MLQLYAGVTRGKKLVVLVGQKKAVAIVVKKRRRPPRLEQAPTSSSIKERIYASAAGQPGRFGLLIYTSTAGAQGKLGGLSETAYRVPSILDRALRRVELCSND